ncbi:MAG: nodulation protein NfeD [Candidatus Acidoferrales bacterium]|nr:nodulation protein NfeD [Candidatus Acidoferrales bacterium]
MAFQLLRRLLLIVCAVVAPSLVFAARAAAPVSAPATSPSPATVVQLRVDGDVEPILAEYLVNGIEQAGREHATLILITINTPGGLDTSMRSIIQAILSSPVPVVTFVNPTGSRAASAGFFILLSADVAAMSPGTDTGAASPIMEMFGQPAKIDETLHNKILNEATAYLRSYVSKRNRNAELAATAVTDAKAFSAQEALDGKLIDFVATSPEDLIAKLDGRTITRFDGSTVQLALSNVSTVPVSMTVREKFLSRIVEPDVFFILLIAGALGIYTEFTHPGLFAPGVIGAIALVLAIISMQMLPVNLAGLLLIVLALGLFVLEAKYPTHGVLGVGGVISMVLGALFLIRTPWTGMGVSLGTALGVALPFAVIVIVLMRLVLRSRSWKQATGKEELLAEEGEVTEPVGSAPGEGVAIGMVRIHGELWRAAGPVGQTIPKGARVRVRKVDGLTLEVEPVNPRPA